MHACVGEGNSNPLQYSCLENPKDRGVWWAAVYWVAESRTQLKRLSSSSSSRRKKKHVNRGAKMEPEASLLFMSSGSSPEASRRLKPPGCIFLCLPNKTELYHSSVCCLKFLLWRDRTKEITKSPNVYGAVSQI